MKRALVVLGMAVAAGVLTPVPALAGMLSVTAEGRVGPYIPDLDPYRGANALDTSQGITGFACQFGFGIRPAVFFSPQLTVFDLFGTITVGADVGAYTIRGRRLFNPADCNSGTGLTTEELTILPVMATATYRFDWALDRYRIPLVPYIRAGVGGAGWLITQDGKPAESKPQQVVDSNGNPVLNSDGEPIYSRRDPIGFSFGGKLALGMMVALDFLEPMRALHARAKGVYEHTFFFVEAAMFDAGLYQNTLLSLLARPAATTGLANYFGPTLIVGTERLPLVSGGLAITF